MSLARSFVSLRQLPELLDLAAEAVETFGLPESVIFKAQVVLEELFVNIFLHSYHGKDGPVDVSLETDGQSLLLRLEETGAPFDPLQKETPDLQKRFAEGQEGGAGLVLIRDLAADIRYVRERDRNILQLRIDG
jgi:anti-sigma regulatory factor (Ser/Thr protein kinase)